MPNLDQLLLSLPILLLSLTAHEFAHAWVALRQGDDTAYRQGRVTLDPRVHIDPVGSILFPGIAILSGAPLLGWARPVQTNPNNYRHYIRGDVLVSVAGVCANAVLAVVFAAAVFALTMMAPSLTDIPPVLDTAIDMATYGVVGNVGLIFFNLLPVPPLDGSHVFYHLLPPKAAESYRQLMPYGMLILWGMVLLGGFAFLRPVVRGVTNFLLAPSGWQWGPV